MSEFAFQTKEELTAFIDRVCLWSLDHGRIFGNMEDFDVDYYLNVRLEDDKTVLDVHEITEQAIRLNMHVFEHDEWLVLCSELKSVISYDEYLIIANHLSVEHDSRIMEEYCKNPDDCESLFDMILKLKFRKTQCPKCSGSLKITGTISTSVDTYMRSFSNVEIAINPEYKLTCNECQTGYDFHRWNRLGAFIENETN